MRSRHLGTLLLALAYAGPAAAQAWSNDLPLHNGGDVLSVYTFTSVGAPVGTSPPLLSGDLFWKVFPGDRVLQHQTAAGAAMEVDGYIEVLFDTDWSTSPPFYDRSHGPALPDATGALQPAFFQLGWTSEVLVSPGPSGFGNPCSIVPSLCSPSGGTCPPPGFVNGYQVEIAFGATPGSGVVLSADGTAASDSAATWFFPGGMVGTGGTCGLGDFALQDNHSTNETMVGLPNGTNPYGGSQLQGSGPVPDPASETATATPTFRDRVLNARADTGTGLGVEGPATGGGALNALRLAAGSGLATLGWEVRAAQDAGQPNVAAVGLSLASVPNPGAVVLGAHVLVVPSALFLNSLPLLSGTLVGGAFQTVQVPVPPALVGTDLYAQGFVLLLSSGLANSTNVVRTSFFP